MSDTAQSTEPTTCASCGRQNPPDARFCSSCGQNLGKDDPEADGPSPSDHGVVADPLIGRVIADRYKIQSLIGRGGMGVVYKVEHVHIGKLMAMKLLHGELARDKDTVKRFRREAEAASKLSHRNTVQIFDFGRTQGLMYLVMEYISGRDFGWIIQHEGPLEFARVAKIIAQICGSVGEAHGLGIVHRDLKPENVMIAQGRDEADFVKVLDFGLAKLREGGPEGTQVTLTRAGSIIGTPYYMAPEHIRGDNVDARADVYAVGAMIYKAVTGVPPFWAPTPMGVLTKHLTEEIVPPTEKSSRRDLPEVVDQIVARAMQKDPADRYQRMEELRADLLGYLESIGQPVEDSHSRPHTRPTPINTASGRAKVVPVATRGDVEWFEKRIRRKSMIGYVLGAALIAAGIFGAIRLWQQQGPAPPSTREREPNNQVIQANALPVGVAVRGQIGRRQSDSMGDVDVYSIRNPGGVRRLLRFAVSAVPNLDLEVDVVRAGIETPMLQADGGGRGEGEAVPNFPLDGSTYFLRVREHWIQGEWPTETVSDHYEIVWGFVEPQADEEREINDSLELATPIEPNGARTGFIGWAGDVDTYCLAADAPAVTAQVEAVATLDLVLRAVNRGTLVSRKIDDNGVGGSEQLTEPVRPAQSGQTCFEVSVTTDRQGRRADASETARYRLRLTTVP